MNKIRHHSASGGRPKTSLTGTRFHKRSTQNPILDAGRKVGCVPEQTFVLQMKYELSSYQKCRLAAS